MYIVGARRTSYKFAIETLGSAIRAVEQNYEFLKHIDLKEDESSDKGFRVITSPEINPLDKQKIGKALESLIRLFYNDLSEEAGLYFITEFKEYTDEKIINSLEENGVDLEQIQTEQHHAYRRRKRKESIKKSAKEKDEGKTKNLLGYSWKNVAKWKHDPGSKFCTLYDKEGKVLDRLNLDRIIENYVEELSGIRSEVSPGEIEKETRIYEKEYNLLKLMLQRDMNAENAMNELNISREELNRIINKLSKMEMLHYVSYDTVELTDTGVSYLSEKEK